MISKNEREGNENGRKKSRKEYERTKERSINFWKKQTKKPKKMTDRTE